MIPVFGALESVGPGKPVRQPLRIVNEHGKVSGTDPVLGAPEPDSHEGNVLLGLTAGQA